MKTLKITLLLAIFCLTFSGQSADVNKTQENNTFETNKAGFKDLVVNKKNINIPSQA